MAKYVPDDSRITSAALEYLVSAEGRKLRDDVAALPDVAAPTVSQVAGLRKDFPLEAIHAALTLAAVQARAAQKFPTIPYVFATPEALEQATGFAVGQHKARRFAAQGPSRIVDLCSGIGGDTLALAHVAPTTAVDLSEARLACLRLNAAGQVPPPAFPIETVVGDVEAVLPALPTGALFHIDPARRHGGKRSPRYADLIPGPEVLEKIIAHFAGGAIKLSPAVDFESLPSNVPTHLELISHHRSVVQAVLYTGVLATAFEPGTRTASLIAEGGAWSYAAVPAEVTLPPLFSPAGAISPSMVSGATLYELDGALTRASLAGPFAATHDLAPLTSDGGYVLSADARLAAKLPCLTAFRLISVVPYTENGIKHELRQFKDISSRLAHGPVEVKSRGHLRGIDNDALQRAFSKITPYALTVLIFRHHEGTFAALAVRP